MREMKYSGVEWIGEIPKYWEIRQVRSLFEIGRGRVISQQELDENGEYPVYSSQTKDDGCLGFINSYDYDVEQITWTTDGANAGTVFIRNGKHNCTNICGTLQASDLSQNLRYQKYALEHIAYYHKRADTNGFKIMNNEMAAIRTICPPLFEQLRIADYLDAKCAQIDRAIARQQEVIEKLKEYKLSVITEAVTKGLNPDVPMKDSGIEWIGEIPEHWDTFRIAALYYEVYEEGNDDLPILSVSINTGVSDRELDDEEQDRVFVRSDDKSKYKRVQISDLTYNMMRAWQGAFGAVRVEGMVSPAYVVARPHKKEDLDSRYIEYLLRTTAAKEEMRRYSHGIADFRLRLYWAYFKSMKICFPEKQEQEGIADYIDKKSAQIDSIITRKDGLISKLTDYKKSLIYEIVTGKREV